MAFSKKPKIKSSLDIKHISSTSHMSKSKFVKPTNIHKPVTFDKKNDLSNIQDSTRYLKNNNSNNQIFML